MTTTRITNGGITEVKIIDGAVSNTKVGANAIDYSKLAAAIIANQSEAEAGVATDKLMTPERTKQAIDQIIATGTVAASGEITLNDIGLEIKWGTTDGLSATGNITYTTAFSNTNFIVITTNKTSNRGVSITSKSTTQFGYNTYISSAGTTVGDIFDWIAIGN